MPIFASCLLKKLKKQPAMKNILSLVLFFIITFSGKAQILGPSVISSAGEQYTHPNYSLVFTLGEPVIATIEGPNGYITQGFNQSIFVITTIDEVEKTELPQVSIYPNPASTFFYLNFVNQLPVGAYYQMFDILGNHIATQNITENTQMVDLSVLSNTTYIIRIFTKELGLIKSFKIQKTE